jgi:hypothetical protein
VASRSESKKAKLASLLRERAIDYIDETAFAEIATALAPVSAGYLRGLLRESGVPLSAAVEGVNQSGFEDLERTLSALATVYASSDAMRRKALRDAVITAKDHARLSTQRAQDQQKQRKEEMVLWMRTWLENPLLFASWVALRKRAMQPTESRSIEP